MPLALAVLVDTAVSRYHAWADSEPVMLVHAATAPRAAALVLPALPQALWLPTYDAAWAVTAAISAIYRPARPTPAASHAEPTAASIDQPVDVVVARAMATGDAHAIKFAEVAQESHARGNPLAADAAARAAELITAD